MGVVKAISRVAATFGAVVLIGGTAGIGLTAIAALPAGAASSGIPLSWGYNGSGELGNGSAITVDGPTPAGVHYPTGVTAVSLAAGQLDAYSIGSNGILYSWGDNTAGALGGASYTRAYNNGGGLLSQVAMPTGVQAVAVAGGDDVGYAIGNDGNVYAWGLGAGDALGPGTIPANNNDGHGDSDKPILVPLPSGVSAVEIAAGYQDGYAIGSDGNVYAWGSNTNGQLGDANNNDSATPQLVQLPAGVEAESISAGQSFAYAVGSDGNVYAWGFNGTGALGDGGYDDSNTPVQVQLPVGVIPTTVTAGYASGYAIASGQLYDWGDNFDGALGHGFAGGQNTTPSVVTLAAGVSPIAVAAANDSAYLIGSNQKLYAWGNGNHYAMGNNSTTASNPSPTAVTLGSSYALSMVAAGQNSGYVLPSALNVTGGSVTLTAGTFNTFTVTTAGYSAIPTITESGTLPDGMSFKDNGDSTATLSGTPTCASAGPYVVTVTADDGVDAPVTQVLHLTVKITATLPTFTSDNSDEVMQKQPMTPFTVTTSNSSCVPVASLTEVKLPPGVTLTDNGDGTGTISGTPTINAAGIYNATLTAKYVLNTKTYSATQAFTMQVDAAPHFKSAAALTKTSATAINFTVKTLAYPVAALSLTSASPPAWLHFVDNGNGTGALTGTPPATGGQWKITFTATNTYGSVNQNFTINVDAPPVFTSANNTSIAKGAALAFTVAATGYPSPKITEAGTLPAGVTFTTGSGTAKLAGRPSVKGTFVITFTATNTIAKVVQTVNQTFTLTVT